MATRPRTPKRGPSTGVHALAVLALLLVAAVFLPCSAAISAPQMQMHGMSAHAVPEQSGSRFCSDRCCDLSAPSQAGTDSDTALTPTPFPLAATPLRVFFPIQRPAGHGPRIVYSPHASLTYLQTLRLRI